MVKYTIITNNPKVLSEYPGKAEFHDSPAEDIFILCRNAVHKGAVLINHPLSGSIEPHINPYRSIVISDSRPEVDLLSVQLIESALSVCQKNTVKKGMIYSKSVHEDFQMIDLDLLNSAINALPSEYQ